MNSLTLSCAQEDSLYFSGRNTDTCNSLPSSPSSPYFSLLLLPLIFTQGLTVESKVASNLWSSCLSLPRVTSRVGYLALIQCDSAKRFFFKAWLLRHTWCVLAVLCWPGRIGFRIALLMISTWEQAVCPITHLPSIWRFIYKVGIWHFFPFLSRSLDYICRILTFSSRSSVLTA